MSETGKESVNQRNRNGKSYTDVQGAARFPIKLPVALKASAAGARQMIETENISANGVLFRMDADVPIGSAVDFTISLPADVVGEKRMYRWTVEDGSCGVLKKTVAGAVSA